MWLGEGQITLSEIAETLAFFTRWNVSPMDGEGNILALQEVEIKGLSDIMHNEFIFSAITNKEFIVMMENEAIGKTGGKGRITETTIGWEFSDQAHELEGFELYEKQPDHTYSVKADYATSDNFRTEIRGKIWKKGSP